MCDLVTNKARDKLRNKNNISVGSEAYQSAS